MFTFTFVSKLADNSNIYSSYFSRLSADSSRGTHSNFLQTVVREKKVLTFHSFTNKHFKTSHKTTMVVAV